MQFIMVDLDLIKNPDLSNDEVLAYALMCDRMKSSQSNPAFFDGKTQKPYVIYTVAEMAKTLKVSIRKVNSLYQHLVKSGLLTKKKQFSRADKLFLPKFKSAEPQDLHRTNASSAGPKTQKLHSNQSQFNQKNKSEIDTVNTRDQVPSNESKLVNWKIAVADKLKLHGQVIDQILKFTKQDVKRAYQIIGIILNAKKNVAKQNNLLDSPVAQFEHNTNLGVKLAIKLSHVFNYTPSDQEAQSRYLTTALKKFFLDAFGLQKDELITPEATSRQTISHAYEPAWLQSTKDAEADVVDPARIAALKSRIKRSSWAN